jgi:hypothetical protein
VSSPDVRPQTVEEFLAAADASPEQREKVTALVERLYGHMLRVVDLGRLFQLDQCLWSEIEKIDLDDEEGALASALIAGALAQVGRGPERHGSFIPEGISPDEVMAADYDDQCLMCQWEAADLRDRMSGKRCEDLTHRAEKRDLDAFMHRAADRWRIENQAALRRFGLSR